MSLLVLSAMAGYLAKGWVGKLLVFPALLAACSAVPYWRRVPAVRRDVMGEHARWSGCLITFGFNYVICAVAAGAGALLEALIPDLR
jgi:hypothetical protein